MKNGVFYIPIKNEVFEKKSQGMKSLAEFETESQGLSPLSEIERNGVRKWEWLIAKERHQL
ncbi:MAG: hypothetical protein PHU31_01930 [Anaerotignum sp.]|nr:hypothetical protein [Anaerotignum sp.]